MRQLTSGTPYTLKLATKPEPTAAFLLLILRANNGKAYRECNKRVGYIFLGKSLTVVGNGHASQTPGREKRYSSGLQAFSYSLPLGIVISTLTIALLFQQT